MLAKILRFYFIAGGHKALITVTTENVPRPLHKAAISFHKNWMTGKILLFDICN